MINLCKSFTYFSSIVTEKINVNKCYFRIVRNKNIIFLKIQPRRERDIWTPARVDNLIHISGKLGFLRKLRHLPQRF